MGVPVALSGTPGRIQGPRAASRSTTTKLPRTNGRRTRDLGDARPDRSDAAAGRHAHSRDHQPDRRPDGGRLLADLGADVIKLEPPEGDMSRPIGRTYFYSVNFNKRSVCVDTRTAAGKEIVQRIAASRRRTAGQPAP